MFRSTGLLLAAVVLLAGAHSASATGLAGERPLNAKPHTDGKNFTANGSMEVGRASHTATLLPNHGVLIVGGYSDVDDPNSLSSAEIYNAKTAKFTYTGSMSTARSNHTATLLANGKVLIAGGTTFYNSPPFTTSTAELFDPATGVFTVTGSMATPRENHTATLLPDGTVLIAGGDDNTGNALDSAELYNPASGVFTSAGSMTTPRDQHTATLLTTGQVLIAGGLTSPVASAELYDPSTKAFTATGSMLEARASHSATLLGNGKVLVAGGFGAVGALTSAELFDPGTGTFAATGSLASPRWGHTATALKDGKVLIATGYSLISPLFIFEPSFTAEIYNPVKGTFTETGPMIAGRANSAATLLQNGAVLVSGGLTDTVYQGRLSNYTDNISELFKSGGGRCTPGAAGCGWRGGDLMTFDQYEWPYGVAEAWLEEDFDVIYGSQFGVMLVGDPSGYVILFDNGPAVAQFLPQSGNPAPLDSNYSDPNVTNAGEFGGDMVALKLNIDYSDAGILLGNPKIAFGDLTLCNMGALTALNGLSVREFLTQANVALSGLPGLYDAGTFDGMAQVLNDAFENENASAFAEQNLVNGPCP